jgi:hypothetical protein
LDFLIFEVEGCGEDLVFAIDGFVVFSWVVIGSVT